MDHLVVLSYSWHLPFKGFPLQRVNRQENGARANFQPSPAKLLQRSQAAAQVTEQMIDPKSSFLKGMRSVELVGT